MAYENSQNIITYGYTASNFTSAITRPVKPPKGCNRGRVLHIHTSVTTTFTQVTTPGYIRVGTAASDALYAELNMGSAAAGTAYSDTDVAGTIKPNGIDLSRDNVTAIQLKTVAPTGGAPAGVADWLVTIVWY